MPTLHWLTREHDLKAAANAEYRLLVEDETYSYGDPDSGNLIVQGDNLEAFKALLPFYAGQVKCIYIDPPYNTGSAFEHYDDNMEHTIWLSMMYPRLKLLKQFLREDGAIFVQIDAEEMTYLKIIMDEIFGRNNFINIISCKAKIAGVSGSNLGKSLQDNIEFILFYAKDVQNMNIKVVPQQQVELMTYIENMEAQGKSWKYTSVLKSIDNGKFIKEFEAGNGDKIKLYVHKKYEIVSVSAIAKDIFKGDMSKAYYEFIDKIFRTTNAQTSIRTKVIENTQDLEGSLFSIEYIPIKGKNAGKLTKFYYKDDNLVTFLKEVVVRKGKQILKSDNMGNLWTDLQYNNITKEGNVQFPNGKKPELLIQRILDMLTNPGDYVLDSFLGSGTTAAVAHKMGRKYIGVEMGEQAKTHCAVRLRKVIDGEQGGISEAVGWKGGGGFRFFTLGEAIFDNERRIKENISFENLAAHIWFTETKTPINRHECRKHKKNATFLGIHDGTAYALLYNGILGDKCVSGGNVLTHATLNHIKHDIELAEKKEKKKIEYNQMVIYGEATRLTHVSLQFNNIIFKQTPYNIKVW
jgi:adenine-specific DNA-methyltransferase